MINLLIINNDNYLFNITGVNGSFNPQNFVLVSFERMRSRIVVAYCLLNRAASIATAKSAV